MNPTLTLPRPLAIAALLAFLGILYGFTLGAQFGANEDRIKAAMEESGRAVLATVYAGDEERMMGVVGRSWTYLQRAHLHGGAIGTAALASILALALLCRGGLVVNLSGLAFGFGALVYPFFWGMAAFRAPGLGGTDAAKASLQWLAVPGAAGALLGLVGTIVCVARDTLFRPRTS